MEQTKNFFGLTPSGTSSVYTYPVHSNDHVIYIDDLSWLEDHQDRLQTIRQAGPEDTIRVVINTPGGAVNIAMAYASAFRESMASIVVHAEGSVCSAGTILWLSGPDRTVSPLTEFMFHNYQGYAYGDGANMHSQIVFWERHFKRLVNEFYDGVLSESEITTILGGGQVWLDEVEMLKRTNAVLLDDKNIKRLQSGQRPIASFDKEKVVAKGEPVKKTVSPEEPEGIYLHVYIGDETFKFDLETLKESDFDAFNIPELKTILSQIGAIAEGKEEPLPEVETRDRKHLLSEILKTAKDLVSQVTGG